VTAAYTGFLAVSAPAMKSYMQLLWTRNRPANERHASDRQLAYNIGRKYIFEQTSHIRERDDVPAEEKALWDEVKALVEQYEANSAVKAFVPKKDQ